MMSALIDVYSAAQDRDSRPPNSPPPRPCRRQVKSAQLPATAKAEPVHQSANQIEARSAGRFAHPRWTVSAIEHRLGDIENNTLLMLQHSIASHMVLISDCDDDGTLPRPEHDV